jgi:hypothetical protein
MGISDKDYADALEHQRLHERALMQLESEKQKKENSLMNTTPGGITTGLSNLTLTTANTGTAIWASPPTGIKTLTEQDLKHDGMKAPLSALVDMWTVRWGGEWVGETEFQNDDFWRLALIRLVGANKLEKHNLANQYMAVYRIIE